MKIVPVLLTGNGEPIANKNDSLTAGKYGPTLLQDFVFLDEMSHFNRERIPERVVHAKGAGNFDFIKILDTLLDKSLNYFGKFNVNFNEY